MPTQKSTSHRPETGHSLPADHTAARDRVGRLIKRSHALENDEPLVPVLQRFQDFIDHDPVIRVLACNMFNEVPLIPPYDRDPTKFEPQIRDYREMFQCLNIILHEGPRWYRSDDPDAMNLIGVPITTLLVWPVGTRSGYAFFSDRRVNEHWRAVLKTWREYLSSEASCGVLNAVDGWTSSEAVEMLTAVGNRGVDDYAFSELYKCRPSEPYYGFRSWDEFFTRDFHDAVRPVAHPDGAVSSLFANVDPTTLIVHACESIPYSRRENVKLHDRFWLKNQPYSLAEMLNGQDKASPFVGGQVYQAYLSPLSYHRWHAPVSGSVVSVENVPGAYFSANYFTGFANVVNGQPKPDPAAPNRSQAYSAEVATRGIITIAADNPNIGLIAIVFIGICEVSSCDFFVKPDDRVTKGQQIGTFRFGGSSYCLVFGPHTKLRFEDPGPYDTRSNNKKVNSILAAVNVERRAWWWMVQTIREKLLECFGWGRRALGDGDYEVRKDDLKRRLYP